MAIRLFLLVFLLQAFPVRSGGGSAEGRRGNALYEKGQYREAAGAYRQGLAGAKDARGEVLYGLQNNLGAALHRGQDYAASGTAFEAAMAAAPSDAAFARAAYNAGNNAAAADELDRALAYYRKALLADPSSEDARYNYELLRRRQQQQQQQQQQGGQQNQDQEQNKEEGGQNNQGQGQQNGDQPQEGQEGQQEGQERQDQDRQDGQQDPSEGRQEDERQGQEREPSQAQDGDRESLNREQAERILQALESDEEQLLREVQKVKGRPRRVEKDW